jgi:hypothetical protein
LLHLLGINVAILDLSFVAEGEFYIKFHLCSKADEFMWILMVVYGPSQDRLQVYLLAEFQRACQENPLPTLIGGDFNILHDSSEKNNNMYNDRWPFIFNAV